MSMFDDAIEVTEVPVTPYVVAFSIAYLVIITIGISIVVLLETKTSSGIGTALLMCAVLYAADKFAKENRRRPESGERVKFALGSTGIALWVQFVLSVIVIALSQLGAEGTADQAGTALLGMGIPVLIAMFAAFGLLYFALCYFLFRWGASWTLKANGRKKP